MCQGKLSMRKLKEILRLKFDSELSNRAIGRAVNVSPSSVSYYARALSKSGKSWKEAQALTDNELEQLLAPHCTQLREKLPAKAELDFKCIHQELKRKGVTLLVLWEEYQKRYLINIHSYSTYCRLYRKWRKKLKPSMRQTHTGGEKCFIDYAGPRVPIRDPQTGEIREAMIFIGAMGASNYIFAEATWTRSSEDWLGSHVRMLEFFGGVPELIIPDNEKSGVTKACYYDPDVNRSYAYLASHYNTVILPTRPYKPQDKASAEVAVQIVERWILARLRKHVFFSLEELNSAIAALLIELNNKPFQKLAGTRKTQFELLDKPALKPLPKINFEYACIKSSKVRLDYHVEVNGHYYSVPYNLINETVEYRLTSHTLEVYYQGNRIASHVSSQEIGKSTTCQEHMPRAHQEHDSWSPDGFVKWAQNIGNSVVELVNIVIENQPHPECCYRVHLGLKRLYKDYGETRFAKACRYALTINTPTFRSIKSILLNKLESNGCSDARAALNDLQYDFKSSPHPNLRGPNYYKNDN